MAGSGRGLLFLISEMNLPTEAQESHEKSITFKFTISTHSTACGKSFCQTSLAVSLETHNSVLNE